MQRGKENQPHHQCPGWLRESFGVLLLFPPLNIYLGFLGTGTLWCVFYRAWSSRVTVPVCRANNTITDRTGFLKSIVYLQHSHQASRGRLERGCNFKLKKSGQDLICLVVHTCYHVVIFICLRPWLGGLKSVMETDWGSAGRKHGCHQQPNPFSVMGA